jgi:branched-chain amino acid aminotransferase
MDGKVIQDSSGSRETPVANSSVTKGWGTTFTEHMVLARYDADQGWGDLELTDYEPLRFEPSLAAFHYGQAIFEGLKVYGQPGGGVAAFRPEQNARRFAASARRLAMAEFPEQSFLESIRMLVSKDREYVPTSHGESLYLRPLEIATDERLQVQPSRTFLYVLMASPVGDYFSQGISPIRVWINTDYARAMPGGTGGAKCAGNYAAAMLAQRQGIENGCDQVVWLDSVEYRYVEEMGAMNCFFVFDDNLLVTPKLTGSLLPGVTRDSILALGSDLGYDIEERLVSMEEWEDRAEDGTLKEVFACGTAAVIAPVGEVLSSSGSFLIANGQTGKLTMKLREFLLGVQHGTNVDTHRWMHPIT